MLRHHPFFVLILVASSLALLLLFTSSHFPPPPLPQLDSAQHQPDRPAHAPERLFGHLRPGRSKQDPQVAEVLWESEERYRESVRRRFEYIERVGPTQKEVVPWPKVGSPELYTMWDLYPPVFNCPWELERVGGMGDGGKWVCGLSRIAKKPGCVIYSVGINLESSFEAELLDRTEDCQVWGYDFSVPSFGPQIEDFPDLAPRAHFFPYGLAGRSAHGPSDDPPMYTLKELMELNGHGYIDLLKIDIEGYEFDVLRDVLRAFANAGEPLPFGQLQLEIHANGKTFAEFDDWFERLEVAGLRPFHSEPNLVYVNMWSQTPDLSEYSFINIRGEHELLGYGDEEAGKGRWGSWWWF